MAALGCHFFIDPLVMVPAIRLSKPDSPSDQWIFVGLLALLVWAPLPLGSNRTWAIGVLLVWLLVLLAGTAVAWRHHLDAAQARLAMFKWPLLLLAGMVCLTWLQAIPMPAAWVNAISPMAAQTQEPANWMTLSLDVFQTRNMGMLAFVYFSVFVVALLTVRHADRLDRLALVLVWSGVLQSVVGAVLFSVKAEYRIFYTQVSHTRMIGTFVYHNSVAGYLCMCLSIGVGLMLSRLSGSSPRRQTWKGRLVDMLKFVLSAKMRLRLLLVVMVIALVLTRSRMGNAAFFTALLVVGLAGMLLARKTAPKTIALIASLVIIDVLVVGTWVGLEKVVERIQETELHSADGGLSESVEARTEAARTALAIVQDFPAVGTGGGSFYNVFLSYRTPQYTYAYVDHTHNDFVEIACDYGLVGLALLGGLVALSLWKTVVVLAKRRANLPRGIAFGVAMSIVALLVHSTVDFNLQIPANALTMVVILAMGWIAATLPRGAAVTPTKRRMD